MTHVAIIAALLISLAMRAAMIERRQFSYLPASGQSQR